MFRVVTTLVAKLCLILSCGLWVAHAQDLPERLKPVFQNEMGIEISSNGECQTVFGKMEHKGPVALPHFRVNRPFQLRTEVLADQGNYHLALMRWQDGSWETVIESASLKARPGIQVWVEPGYYCWSVTGDQAQLAFQLCEMRPIEELRADFVGPDKQMADRAFDEWYRLGPSAIPDLLNMAYEESIYAGDPHLSRNSSIASMELPSSGQMALYLIDAIFYGYERPHYDWRLYSPHPEESATEKLGRALEYYQIWWDSSVGLAWEEIQKGEHPLARSDLRWLGPAKPPGAREMTQLQDGEVGEVPDEEEEPVEEPLGDTGVLEEGSETPTEKPEVCVSNPDGPDPGTDPDLYAWVFKPEVEDGPIPYNCLAWALNCQTDRWIQPVDPDLTDPDNPKPGVSVGDILKDNGYDADNPTTADADCPEGKGPKVKMIYFEIEVGQFTIQQWVHAMKQEEDGDWSSKNGESGRYKDIKDCSKFLDQHYPTPQGARRVVKYFCKK